MIAIGISDDSYSCFSDLGFTVVETGSIFTAIDQLDTILENIDVCENYEPITPYDGSYSITDRISSQTGYPIYR